MCHGIMFFKVRSVNWGPGLRDHGSVRARPEATAARHSVSGGSGGGPGDGRRQRHEAAAAHAAAARRRRRADEGGERRLA